MDVLNRIRTGRLNLQISHPEPHELPHAMFVVAAKFGHALVGAATLSGIALLMRGNVSGDTSAGVVGAMVAVWLVVVLGNTRLRRAKDLLRHHN